MGSKCLKKGHFLILMIARTHECSCWDCFSDKECEVETPVLNCTVDVAVADAGIFEQYFERPLQSAWSTDIPPWYRPPYMPPPLYPPSSSSLANLSATILQELPQSVNNTITKDRSLIIGDGATQVIQAIIFGISQLEGKPMWVFARAPYYPSFVRYATRNPLYCLGFSNRTDLDPDSVIEIVTWPNNPDGRYWDPVYPSARRIIDAVYYWPSTAGTVSTIRKVGVLSPIDEDNVVFSASKYCPVMPAHA